MGVILEDKVQSRRELALDGLRGIGALIVLFWHLSVHFFPAAAWGAVQPASWWWESLIYRGPFGFIVSGSFAVVLFFLLSGYVLTIGYLRNGEIDAMHRRLVGRIPRLFVPATVTTLIFYFCFQYLPYTSGKTGIDVLKETGSFQFLEPYLGFNFDFSAHELFMNVFWLPWFNTDFKLLYNGVLWTMYIELSGSFLAIILTMAMCRVFGRRYVAAPMLILAILPVWIYPGYGLYFSFFILGSFIASLDLKPLLRGPVATIACVLLLLAGLFAGGYTGVGMTSILSFTQDQSGVIPTLILLKGAGATMVFVVTLLSADISKFLSRSFFVWLGSISFSLYLIHPLLIPYIGHSVFFALGDGVPMHYRTVISSFTTIMVALPVSVLLTMWMDEPSVRFSQALGRRVMGNRYLRPPSRQVAAK